MWHAKQFTQLLHSRLSPLNKLDTRHERCSQPTVYFAWLSLGSDLEWHDQLPQLWDLAQNCRSLSSHTWQLKSPPCCQRSLGQVARGEHIFSLKFAQAVLNMEVDRGRLFADLTKSPGGKMLAVEARETIRRPETTSACTRGKLSVYRLEVATKGLQLKLVKTPASRQLLLHYVRAWQSQYGTQRSHWQLRQYC